MLTVYGIEIRIVNRQGIPLGSCNSAYRLRYWNTSSLIICSPDSELQQCLPFTVLKLLQTQNCIQWALQRLQQYLPFTVLKRTFMPNCNWMRTLQQYLPLAVLKLYITIEHTHTVFISCNSTCRLRYWNIVLIVNTACNTVMMLQQCLPFTVLKLRPLKSILQGK